MKKSLAWLAVLLTPALLITPLSAQDPFASKAGKTAEASKPTLSFYYYDG